MIVATALLAALSPSCGARQHKGDGPPSGMLPPGAGWIHGPSVTGEWEWSHVTEEDGVRRVEVEHWNLTVRGAQVTGVYDRRVTFLSVDGVPFDCNQNLSYQVSARYRVSGLAHARWMDLAEDQVQTAPSPCDSGYRQLARYQAFATADSLLLIWPGGSQTLSRAADPLPSPPAAATALAGSWVWRSRTEHRARGEVTVEREEWELAEDGGGRVTGTYLRDVTVFHPDGGIYACSGAGYYRYRDRYTLVGSHTDDRLFLTEVAVDPEQHACLREDAKRRHLDTAGARINGGHLELTWRGGHRQVLHRPDDVTSVAQR